MPIIIIFLGLLLFSINSYKHRIELQNLENNIIKIDAISELINDLQQERGLTSGFIGSHGKDFKDQLLKKEKNTDASFGKFISTLNHKNIEHTILYKTLLDFRKKSLNNDICIKDSFDYYTKLIQKIQINYLKIGLNIDDSFLNQKLQSYTNLSFMKESLGRIRATINGILTKKELDLDMIKRTTHAKALYDIFRYKLYATISPEFKNKLQSITSSNNYSNIQIIINKYAEYKDSNSLLINENPNIWFKDSTKAINKLYKLEQKYLDVINKYLKKKSKANSIELILEALVFLFSIFFTAWVSMKLKNDIMRGINLLNQYKNIVDNSSIVSKTTKRGIITYTNKQFQEISGYTEKELVGKPHSIVRHPEMPKDAFRQMWKTILSKKTWNGIVKNKKKDGSTYTVEATISPILNENGEISEFIALRNDISEVIELHEEVEKTQTDLIFRMSELTETRSKETGFHVRRVAKYSELLGKYYGLDDNEIKNLTIASPMHDIGKVGIVDSILHKPSTLDEQEWKIMKTHTTIGYNLFKGSDKPLLKAAAVISHEHHERYDGEGYPKGLKGENIHIFARITALADTFDALNSKRSYKDAWEDKKIFAYLRDQKGRHFDPKLVDIFFEHIDEFLYIRSEYRDTTIQQYNNKDKY